MFENPVAKRTAIAAAIGAVVAIPLPFVGPVIGALAGAGKWGRCFSLGRPYQDDPRIRSITSFCAAKRRAATGWIRRCWPVSSSRSPASIRARSRLPVRAG